MAAAAAPAAAAAAAAAAEFPDQQAWDVQSGRRVTTGAAMPSTRDHRVGACVFQRVTQLSGRIIRPVSASKTGANMPAPAAACIGDFSATHLRETAVTASPTHPPRPLALLKVQAPDAHARSRMLTHMRMHTRVPPLPGLMMRVHGPI